MRSQWDLALAEALSKQQKRGAAAARGEAVRLYERLAALQPENAEWRLLADARAALKR
jgi:hypothetical protein